MPDTRGKNREKSPIRIKVQANVRRLINPVHIITNSQMAVTMSPNGESNKGKKPNTKKTVVHIIAALIKIIIVVRRVVMLFLSFFSTPILSKSQTPDLKQINIEEV